MEIPPVHVFIPVESSDGKTGGVWHYRTIPPDSLWPSDRRVQHPDGTLWGWTFTRAHRLSAIADIIRDQWPKGKGQRVAVQSPTGREVRMSRRIVWAWELTATVESRIRRMVDGMKGMVKHG